jgi:antitoxin (DNA-binding transcriptional repressor) of toxin-antitoxin stability system
MTPFARPIAERGTLFREGSTDIVITPNKETAVSRLVSVTEVARNFSKFINRVVRRGEDFVLTREGKAVAELRPVSAGRKISELPKLFASLPRLDAEEAAAYARDVDAAREELAQKSYHDPWEF